MDRFHRYYALHRLLKSRRLPVPRAVIERELECSKATTKRIIEEMRNIDAPIEYERGRNGYRYTHDAFELPGIWFNASELYALLATQKLLAEAEPGLLADLFEALRRKIDGILAADHLGEAEIAKRVRILRMAGRGAGEHFQTVAGALLQRRRLAIRYHGRASDEITAREVSPQRLVHYRDNWYLDAWCHWREDLRSFALDRIREARASETRALDIPEERLHAHFATAYGIFAGEPGYHAVLRFTAERARWVADEQWHPRQQGRFLEDGRYELEISYSDPRELVMDVLKHGRDVEVVAPPELRDAVADELQAALQRYSATG